MSWMQTIPTIAIGLLLLFAPGALLARTMGARGLTLLSAAAPLTVSIASLAAIALQVLHIGWSAASMILSTLLVAGLTAAARILWLRRRSGELPKLRPIGFPSLIRTAGYAVAVLMPAAIIFYRFSRIIGSPEHISQTYDNVFHLNALRVITDSGRASSLTLASLDPSSDRMSFYPAAWHDVVALVAQAGGGSIPVGLNATNMIIAGLVWPLSAMFLVSTLTGRRLVPVLMTGALAAGFSSFPYLMIDFGVLYPNVLSIALLPFCLGALAGFLGIGREATASRALYFWLLAVSSIGLTLAHPSTTMALIAFAVSPLLYWFGTRVRRLYGQPHWLRDSLIALAAVAAYGVAAVVLWNKVRPSDAASFWAPMTTVPRAVGEAITSAPQGNRDVPWLIFALTVVGILVLFAQRRLWILGCFVISAGFYAVVSGYPAGPVRSFWTGVWYNDSYRLAALLPVTAIAIAAVGGSWLIERAHQRLHRWPQSTRVPQHALTAAGTILLIVAAGALTQGRSIDAAQARAARAYASTVTSPLLSSDEESLLKRLDRHVPTDSVVIGNPWTGASLVYPYTGRRALLPAISSSPTPEEKIILNRLNAVSKDPKVCEAIQQENSYFVLDFGPEEVHQGKHAYPGMANLAEAPGLRLVDTQGAASLYEVVACR